MSTRAISQTKRGMAVVGIFILVLGGFGFLSSAATDESHGLKAWLLPFGPWCCALLAYGLLHRPQKN